MSDCEHEWVLNDRSTAATCFQCGEVIPGWLVAVAQGEEIEPETEWVEVEDDEYIIGQCVCGGSYAQKSDVHAECLDCGRIIDVFNDDNDSPDPVDHLTDDDNDDDEWDDDLANEIDADTRMGLGYSSQYE